MPELPTLVGLLVLLLHLGVPACSGAPTDTLSAGAVLAGDDRLVSNNSKFTLGFFLAPDGTAGSPDSWYLGVWFTAVPMRTTVWVANGGRPIVPDTTTGGGGGSPELHVSDSGDLVVVDRATNSQTWSARPTNATTSSNSNATTAVLLDSGNLILLVDASSTVYVWQSFDYPTDTLLPTAKFGIDRRTGLNRRLVSRRSTATPSPGPYCYEADPTSPQLVMRLCDDPSPYWTTGAWNGRFFANIPELSGDTPSFRLAYVNNAQEAYLQYNVSGESTVTRNFLDVDGVNRHQVWLGAPRGWLTLFFSPKSRCDVHAACGPFSVCGVTAQACSCLTGFSVASQADWDQGDQRGGCARDAPLDCTAAAGSNSARAPVSSTDRFVSVPDIGLPDGARRVQNATSEGDCSTACLNNCSCSAYSYGGPQGCLVWHDSQDGLLNAKQPPSTPSSGGTLHIRLAANGTGSKKSRGVVIGAVTGAAAFGLLVFVATALIVRRRRKKTKDDDTKGSGLVSFTYKELRSATTNFSDKLGQGGFGSVFKGQLLTRDATAVAVKRLDGSFQGDKQFRAEVSSIGVVQHVNLVKLVGFCCEADARLLVYELVPNRSLDIHLFPQSGTTGGGGAFLDWAARYRIAVGVARGLAYLHEGCRDRIIHCDVKPQNVLLDAALLPKLADFGMAKLVGRDFSRVLTTMRGTKGYLAPEWIGGTAVTPKVDVYSYGMVLLELVSGRRNADQEEESVTASDGERVVYFPMRAARELRRGGGGVAKLLDDRLRGDANLKEVERVCKVACWCIQDDEDHRPTMGEVVQMLEGLLDRDIPPLPRLLETIFGRPQSLMP